MAQMIDTLKAAVEAENAELLAELSQAAEGSTRPATISRILSAGGGKELFGALDCSGLQSTSIGRAAPVSHEMANVVFPWANLGD